MNDLESVAIGLSIWIGGALVLYFILKCIFNGQKTSSNEKWLCCRKGNKSQDLPTCGCFPLNLQFTHVYQLFYSLAAFFIIVWGTYYIFGMDAVNSLLTGFMIGGGLALKPLMKTVVNGFTADGVNLMGKNIELEIGGKTVVAQVVRIGMLHTWVMPEDSELVMVHNDLLNLKPLVIKTNPMKAETLSSKYRSTGENRLMFT